MSEADPYRWVRAELLKRRVVLARGAIDDVLAGQIAAELMLLDASGDGPVAIHIDSGGGPLHSAFALIDTIDLLGVPVEAVCVGRAEGSAVGVLAAAPKRSAAPHARMRLAEPESSVSGRPAEIVDWAAHHQAQLTRFAERLAQATLRPLEHVEADLAAGRWLSATEAVDYGLVDGIWTPHPSEGTRRPFGFGPA